MSFAMIRNPLFGSRGKQIGGVTLRQAVCHILVAIVHGTIALQWVMVMPIVMPGIAIVKIEAAQQGMRGF